MVGAEGAILLSAMGWIGSYTSSGLQGLGILLFFFAVYLIFSYFGKRLDVEGEAS